MNLILVKAWLKMETDRRAITQYGSFSSVNNRHSQDGYSAATLTSLAFDDDGVLSAVYNNGQVKNVAQIAILAKFDNNEGLYKKGKNLLKEKVIPLGKQL